MQPILIIKILIMVWTQICMVAYICNKMQLSCRLLLNFIAWKNNVCEIHFGLVHHVANDVQKNKMWLIH